MTCVYELEAVTVCPVDKKPDVYWITVRAHRTVMVEDILSAVKKATAEPLTQEGFTESLHRLLACEVVTVGFHGGVKTTVTCGCGA